MHIKVSSLTTLLSRDPKDVVHDMLRYVWDHTTDDEHAHLLESTGMKFIKQATRKEEMQETVDRDLGVDYSGLNDLFNPPEATAGRIAPQVFGDDNATAAPPKVYPAESEAINWRKHTRGASNIEEEKTVPPP